MFQKNNKNSFVKSGSNLPSFPYLDGRPPWMKACCWGTSCTGGISTCGPITLWYSLT